MAIQKSVKAELDSRSRISINAIGDAFIMLLMQKPYDEFNVRHIVESAGVARSTFYEHFHSKDHLLIYSMDPIYEQYARNVFGTADLESNNCLLDILWEKRSIFRRMCKASFFNLIVDGFDNYLDERLVGLDLDGPVKVLTKQLAYALLMPVNGWLQGQYPATKGQMSEILMGAKNLLDSHRR